MTIWNLGSINVDLFYRVPHLPLPGETVNQASNPAFREILLQHRRFLAEHASRHRDEVAAAMLGAVG